MLATQVAAEVVSSPRPSMLLIPVTEHHLTIEKRSSCQTSDLITFPPVKLFQCKTTSVILPCGGRHRTCGIGTSSGRPRFRSLCAIHIRCALGCSPPRSIECPTGGWMIHLRRGPSPSPGSQSSRSTMLPVRLSLNRECHNQAISGCVGRLPESH